MIVSNSNNGNGRRRDENGLTDKQRQSLPIITVAPSIHKGMRQCIEKGIVGSREYFYKTWWKQDAYVKAVTEARAEYQGTIRDEILNRFRARAPEIADKMLDTALSGRADSIRACENVLAALGVELGKGNRVNVSQSVSSEDQREFAEKIRDIRLERAFGPE